MTNKIWLIGYENRKWWCADRSPLTPPLSSADTYINSLKSAHNEAQLVMMKHHPRRDMTKAKIVYPLGMMGIGVLSAPEYIDYTDKPRKTPDMVWVVEEAPTRYQALKIAKADHENTRLLIEG